MRNNWTNYEVEVLKINYPEYGTSYCQKLLKRSKTAILTKAKRLNLHRSNRLGFSSRRFSESIRQRWLRYKLSPEEYNSKILNQRGVCAICNQPPGLKGLFVDHDHKTGEVRGLLCHHCNILLGMAKDNLTVLQNSIRYLDSFGATEGSKNANLNTRQASGRDQSMSEGTGGM